ncbi:MAG: nucleoside triphosphate pyrophosphohydrolase [Alteromonadaceae bacterium]|nr:MAG: nucleoside triphosphate pyrophosphohydrolase [Alteromonadaceae bacterium]
MSDKVLTDKTAVDTNPDGGTSEPVSHHLQDLLTLMARLRAPDDGCPWDLKQDYRSITSSTIEECYELVDAIEQQNFGHLKEELGDYVFQAVFYAQLAKEDGHFDFNDVIDTLTAKLLRRHPHVFPDGTLDSRRDPNLAEGLQDEQIRASWDAIKQQERDSKGQARVLDDVPLALPALSRAFKLQKRAAKVGFDWSDSQQVFDKLDEELGELHQALAIVSRGECDVEGKGDSGGNNDASTEKSAAVADELGDVLFTCVNLARKLGFEPEALMRSANSKFERRFNSVESQVTASGKPFDQHSTDALEVFWKQAKKQGL